MFLLPKAPRVFGLEGTWQEQSRASGQRQRRPPGQGTVQSPSCLDSMAPGCFPGRSQQFGQCCERPRETGVALQEATGGPCKTGWTTFPGLILGKNDTGHIIAASMSQGLLLCRGLVMSYNRIFSRRAPSVPTSLTPPDK